jgi:hypothetical protein
MTKKWRTALRFAKAYRQGAYDRCCMGGSLFDMGACSIFDQIDADADELGNPLWAEVFFAAAERGQALAQARKPLPGQELPVHLL